MINIIVNGALGKMGQLSVNILLPEAGFNIVAKTTREDDLVELIKQTKPDVVLDFTNASHVFSNAKKIIAAGVHPVIGTTGLLSDQIQSLQKACREQELGGIIAPNFSIGALLMMRFAVQAAKYFAHAEVIERHHEHKQDAPSGTAMRTAELISQVRKNAIPPTNAKEIILGARGADLHSIPIHSLRTPGSIAHQEVIFGGKGETLTIKHDTNDRECFAHGILLACRKVVELKELVYGLEHIIEI